MRARDDWINTGTDHGALETHVRKLLQGGPARLYATFPSVKSGDERFQTAELISIVDPRDFPAWRDRPNGQSWRG